MSFLDTFKSENYTRQHNSSL